LSGDEALTLLRQIPLVESRQFGPQSLRQYRIVTGAIKTVAADEQPTDLAQDLAKLEAAFQGADIAVLKSSAQAAAGAVDHLSAIEKNLQDRTGGIPEGLAALRADVREINAVFAAELTRRGEAPAGDPAPGSADKPHGQAGSALQGEIRSRADVVRTLDALCDYYVRNEPSSPVPLLLKRAKRLVDKDFMDIIRDLAPAGVAEAEVIGGLEKKES
jgi:type VI secretion system protein ImpA